MENRQRQGLNIRVLNLSFGTASTQDYTIDPLAYAAEVAWRKGIVVVAAAGNDGTQYKTLANPASHPLVIAVGADDTRGTLKVDDDQVPAFSSRGTNVRHVDFVAPGVSVLGLRNPGSLIDQQVPSAVVGTRFFRGSGTSQAAAVTSGAVALLLQRYPTLTPDQVKLQLVATSTPFSVEASGLDPSMSAIYRGAGLINVRAAQTRKPTVAMQVIAAGTGTGTLEGARGGSYVYDGGTKLTGERDIFGKPFSSAAWAKSAAAATSWTGGTWNGTPWTGETWVAAADKPWWRSRHGSAGALTARRGPDAVGAKATGPAACGPAPHGRVGSGPSPSGPGACWRTPRGTAGSGPAEGGSDDHRAQRHRTRRNSLSTDA